MLCSLQLDDVHETAPYSHPSDVSAVEVAKSAFRMKTAIQSSASARPAQVLAGELITMSQDVQLVICFKNIIFIIITDNYLTKMYVYSSNEHCSFFL